MAKITTSKDACSACGGSGEVERVDPESLRTVRQEVGVSLRAMAEVMGVSPGYLSDVELGRRNVTERVLIEYRKLEGDEHGTNR